MKNKEAEEVRRPRNQRETRKPCKYTYTYTLYIHIHADSEDKRVRSCSHQMDELALAFRGHPERGRSVCAHRPAHAC